MNIDRWAVLVVAPCPHAQDWAVSLTRAGACAAIIDDSEAALSHPALLQSNIIIVATNAQPIGGVHWVERFRRQRDCPSRKVPTILCAERLTPSLAKECAKAGANAVIGLPLGPRTLVKTMKHVLGQPRPFLESAAYVGPCNLNGIITVWPAARSLAAKGR